MTYTGNYPQVTCCQEELIKKYRCYYQKFIEKYLIFIELSVIITLRSMTNITQEDYYNGL